MTQPAEVTTTTVDEPRDGVLWCRTFDEQGVSVCDAEARYIVWGHLYDKNDKGPKCWDHAPKPRAGHDAGEMDFVAVMPHTAIYEIPTMTQLLTRLARENNVTTEWQVAWFPYDKPDQEQVFLDEAKARRAYQKDAKNGHNPILCERTVRVSEWSILEDPVKDGA